MIDTPTHPTHEEDRSMSSKTRSRVPASRDVPQPVYLTLLPALVQTRFEMAEDRQWYRNAGPVTARDIGPASEIAELAARALANNQHELAFTLSAAVAALEALRPEAKVA